MIVYLVFQKMGEGMNLLAIYLDIEMAFDYKDRCQKSDPGEYYYIMPYVLIQTDHRIRSIEEFTVNG